jgi:O-antigen/teichoic acid export membrane protein
MLGSKLSVDKALQADIKTIARNAGVSGFGDIFSAAMIFGTTIFMTRMVGAAIYGIFVLAKNTAMIGTILGNFGLEKGLLYFLPFHKGRGNWDRAKGSLVSSTRLTAIFSFSTAALLFLGADLIAKEVFHNPLVARAIRVLAFSIPGMAFVKLWLSGVQAFRVLKYSVLVDKIIRPLTCLAVLSLLFMVGLKLYSLVFAELTSVLLAAGLAYYFLRRLFPLRWRENGAVANRRELLGFSAPLFLMDSLNFILTRVDVIMLGIFLMSQQVGIYYAATRVAMLQLIPLASVNSIFAPMIAEYHGRGDLVSLRRNFKVATRWILSLAFPLCLFVILFPVPLLRLFGPEFIIGSTALVILAVGQLVDAATGPVDYIIMMTGHPKLNLSNSLCLALLNVILNLLLIPRFGIVGAAVATATSAAVVNLLRLAEVYYILKVHPYRWDFMKPLAAGILAATFTYTFFVRNTQTISWLLLGMGMLSHFSIYIGAMVLFGLPEEEKLVLKSLLAKLRPRVKA